MDKGLLWIGRLTGTVGAFVSILAAAVRVSGQYYLGSIQAATLLQAGIAAMLLGCLCLLAVLTADSRPRQ